MQCDLLSKISCSMNDLVHATAYWKEQSQHHRARLITSKAAHTLCHHAAIPSAKSQPITSPFSTTSFPITSKLAKLSVA
jgi:hypothetical protein